MAGQAIHTQQSTSRQQARMMRLDGVYLAYESDTLRICWCARVCAWCARRMSIDRFSPRGNDTRSDSP